MDELKKDGLSPEEENAAAQAEAEDTAAEEAVVDAEEITEEKNELETELENLRDMFQQELDKAAAGVDSDDSGMLIQELEEIYEEEAEQEIPEEDFCECCGEKIRFKEFDEDYPYCEDCRNAMKKYPLRKSGILAFLASIALVVASVWVSYPYMNDAVNLADASANYQEGYVMTALQSYYSYFNGSKTGDGVSKRALSEIIEGYVNLGYHTNAADLINTYYSEADLKKPWNKKYSSVIKEATVLTETYEAVTEITKGAFAGEKFDYDTLAAQLDALKEVNPLEEGKSQVTDKYNEVFIEYYKYVLLSMKEVPLEKQLEQLKHIDSIGEGQEWVYLANYCAVAAKLGDEEAVNYSFDKLTALSKEDSTAYISKANLYRFTEKPDADKMLAVCDEAKLAVSTSDVSYKHPLAIAYLLKGEGTLALEEITALFNAGNYTVQNCNLYALCGLYNGDKEIYDEMKTLLAGYGYEISDLVTQYKDGKLSIEEIIADKGGDI